MNRLRLWHAALALVLTLAVVWVARNTEWGEVTLPAPLRGEAARNPFYAAQRFVEALDATSAWQRSLGRTSPAAVVVLSNWSWDVNTARRREFESWVEAGGRLVVDASLINGSDAFETWSGIERVRLDPSALEDVDEFESEPAEPFEPCEDLLEIRYESNGTETELGYYEGCDFDRASWLVAARRLDWALGASDGLQVARVPVGAGSVTVINAVPFHYRALFDGDHGLLLAAATELVAGDRVVFLSEEDYASLPELVWQNGAPVVVVALLVIALALWRNSARFGPLVAATERARRSLSAQILGTGRFVMRVGGGAALRAAAARALHEAGALRVAGYGALTLTERVHAVARLANLDAAALAAALEPTGSPRSHELKTQLELLERARRQLVLGNQRSKHGKPV